MSIKRRLEKLGRDDELDNYMSKLLTRQRYLVNKGKDIGIGPIRRQSILDSDEINKKLNNKLRNDYVSKTLSKQRNLLNKGKDIGLPGGPAKGFHKPQGFSPKKFVNKVW